jgi:[ribosomal protein S5]-alanine N-acetyltransferase
VRRRDPPRDDAAVIDRRIRLVDGPTAIRPFGRGDLDELVALRRANRDHTEPWEPLRDPSFYGRSGQRAELEMDVRAWEQGVGYAFAATDSATGAILGRVALANVVRGAWLNATLGYWMSAHVARQGHGTRAVRLVLRFAFEHAGLHRVQPAIIPRNEPSQRLARAAGFRLEGRALRYLRINGVWEDHDLYAMTAEDWQALRSDG